MKSFNLEKALAGDQVITRCGKPVYELTYFRTIKHLPLRGVIDGVLFAFGVSGMYCGIGRGESQHDLFMAPVKREGWVNVYRSSSGDYDVGSLRPDQKKAESLRGANTVATVRVEWEE